MAGPQLEKQVLACCIDRFQNNNTDPYTKDVAHNLVQRIHALVGFPVWNSEHFSQLPSKSLGAVKTQRTSLDFAIVSRGTKTEKPLVTKGFATSTTRSKASLLVA